MCQGVCKYKSTEKEFRRDTPAGVAATTPRESGHLGRGGPTVRSVPCIFIFQCSIPIVFPVNKWYTNRKINGCIPYEIHPLHL